MDKLKAVRGGHRSAVTRQIHKTDEKINEGEITRRDIHSAIENLERKHELLQKLDAEILDSLDAESVEQEILDADEFNQHIDINIRRYKECDLELRSSTPQDSVSQLTSILTPIIFRKLPPELRTTLTREHDTSTWTIDLLRKAIETVSRTKVYPDCNFPEYELITEPEILPKETKMEKSEEDKLEEYEEFMKSKAAESVLPDSAAKDLEKMAISENSQDQVFMKFKERIQDEQEQVLRYQRNGKPLWVSECHIPEDGDIPNCSCGLPRKFEFQIMPQLLTYLEVDSLGDSIDWGTLCVYTCSGSCDIGNNYNKEFLWKQDFSDSNI
ncbi:pre-rRNA-processing protein TSR4 [Mytilus galloprovincialis]|uniref:Pre-rRNA-processing protein TSR4 n=1 Tax=Mytilus galloprovincialis TaxID=29158 RepID=A0A8B6GII0_MYTGA|nr:pre-rRNA-processing protein TSR4 [Mytilus galloprovincialis]